MKYLTSNEVSLKWDISSRRIREGRAEGTV